MSLLNLIIQNTQKFLENRPKSERKKIGQFFTPASIAHYMSKLFDIPENKSDLTILDPGAGSGILSVALIEELVKSSNKINSISLTCYENDEIILDLLKSNLEILKDELEIEFEYKVLNENYITSQEFDYKLKETLINKNEKFDLIICNPPYKKISKSSNEASVMKDICYGSPNIYFLFMGMAVFNLKENGQLVFITPRSWTSGLYFQKFREYFLKNISIDHIHLFEKRKDLFNDEVLQETLIIKARKKNKKNSFINISTSSDSNFNNYSEFSTNYISVVSNKNSYVFLVSNKKQLLTINKVNKWNETLISNGLKLKTGITVDFRNKELLRNESEINTVPLFQMTHLQDGKVKFPIGKNNEYITTEKNGLLQPNQNYLFIKRFTSKEERRRLQCSIYLADEFSKFPFISTQNKVNFIEGIKPMNSSLIYGLYVIFNSTLYDEYYRILNGSTQVNSTEINTIPIPSLETLEEMGKQLKERQSLTVETCDDILEQYYG